jgi:hypothetical protein
MKRTCLVTAAAALTLGVPAGARALPDDPGTRALAMGGAGRGDARGEQGPRLNPAGMSLSRIYTLEGAYEFITHDGGHLAHVAIVDSTSESNLAGALTYSYRTATPAGFSRLSGHEAGVSLSYPVFDRLLLGVTAKYFHVAGGLPEPGGANAHSGFTADVGVVLRAASIATLGVVGYNLRDLSTIQAPVVLGAGAALNPAPDLTLAIDLLHDFTTSDPTRGSRTTVGGGAEYMFQRKLVLRAGGGRDGGSAHGFVSAGLAAVSELGAIDFGLRQDIDGATKLTFLAVALRLFVPQP